MVKTLTKQLHSSGSEDALYLVIPCYTLTYSNNSKATAVTIHRANQSQ